MTYFLTFVCCTFSFSHTFCHSYTFLHSHTVLFHFRILFVIRILFYIRIMYFFIFACFLLFVFFFTFAYFLTLAYFHSYTFLLPYTNSYFLHLVPSSCRLLRVNSGARGKKVFQMWGCGKTVSAWNSSLLADMRGNFEVNGRIKT